MPICPANGINSSGDGVVVMVYISYNTNIMNFSFCRQEGQWKLKGT